MYQNKAEVNLHLHKGRLRASQRIQLVTIIKISWRLPCGGSYSRLMFKIIRNARMRYVDNTQSFNAVI
jgi:hypothetical protein